MANESIYRVIMKAVGFDQSKKKVNGMEKALGGLAKKALLAGGAYFSAQGIIQGARASIDAFARQELAEKKLEQALGNTSKALLNQASALQKMTTAGDEAIIEQMSFLASLDMTEKQISTIIPVALDLAAATGMSLESAVRNTAKTFSGLAGELGELVPQLRDLTAEQMKAGKAVEVMAELFGGAAQAETETLTGSLEQMYNALGDLGESMGSVLAPAISSMAKGLTDLISVPVTVEMDRERIAFDNMLETLKRLNPESQSRKKLIEEMKSLYPGYLGDLDLEKASLEEINEFQKESKEFLMARIAIARNEEEIAEVEATRAQIANELYDAQLKLTAAQKKYDEELESGGTNLVQLVGTTLVTYGNTLDNAKYSLDEAQESVNSLSNEFALNDTRLTELTSGTNAQITAAKALIQTNQQLKESEEDEDDDTTGTTTLGPTKEEIKAATDRHKQFKQIIADQELEASITEHNLRQGRATFASDIEEAKLRAEIEALQLTEEEKQEIYDYYDELRREQREAEAEHQKELNRESMLVALETISVITDALSAGVERRAKKEMDTLKSQDKYKNASREEQLKMEAEVNKKYEDERKRLFYADKAVALSEVAIRTAGAVMKAGEQLGAFSIPMATYLAGLGIAQAAVIAAQPFPEYAEGGLVGGKVHSEGGTIIEAEQGEFVMSRDAVEDIGIDNLENMNTGGGASSPIVINNPIISAEFVETELPELIADAVRKGVSFGVE